MVDTNESHQVSGGLQASSNMENFLIGDQPIFTIHVEKCILGCILQGNLIEIYGLVLVKPLLGVYIIE